MTERVRVCTRFTLDSSLTLRVKISDSGGSQSGVYDTNVDVTIPAGSYYNAWDGQDDDFLYVVMNAVYGALDALSDTGGGVDDYNGSDAAGKLLLSLDENGRVVFSVGGDLDMELAWDEEDGSDVAAILGFDDGAGDQVTSVTTSVTSDYQAGYLWLDTEGLLGGLMPVDMHTAKRSQAVAVNGYVSTQRVGERYKNKLQLLDIPQTLMFSDGAGYGEESVHPYSRNKGLECWWRSARDGVPFRVYREGRLLSSVSEYAMQVASYGGSISGGTTTTLEDSSAAFETDPQEHKGRILLVDGFATSAVGWQRFYVSSHTSTAFTVPNALLGTQLDDNASSYYVLDQTYRTYVLDQRFDWDRWVEIPGVQRYDVEIPLLRYVS